MASLDDVITALNNINRNLAQINQSLGTSVTGGGISNYVIQCDFAMATNAITMTPKTGQPTIGTIVDGTRFRAVPTSTAAIGALVTVTISGATNPGPYSLFAPDGYTFMNFGDVLLGAPLTVQFVASRGVMVLCDFGESPRQLMLGNGQCKLQSDGATSISLTQEDGSSLMIWNPIQSGFRKSNFATVTNANIFAAQNYVSGVAISGPCFSASGCAATIQH